jgi:phage tail protein X
VGGVEVTHLDPKDRLSERVHDMLASPDYGQTRLRIVRFIAEAAPGMATKDDVYRVATEIPEKEAKEPYRMVGGLHSALEQSWRRVGGRPDYGEFFTTSPEGFTMRSDVATAVLQELDEQGDGVRRRGNI